MAQSRPPPYNPDDKPTFEAFVLQYHDGHKQSDLVSPKKLHQVTVFLETDSQIRQRFDEDFGSWVRKNNFVLCSGSVQKQVTDKAEPATHLPVVTVPKIGRAVYALHATVGKRVGQDKIKKLARHFAFTSRAVQRQGVSC